MNWNIFKKKPVEAIVVNQSDPYSPQSIKAKFQDNKNQIEQSRLKEKEKLRKEIQSTLLAATHFPVTHSLLFENEQTVNELVSEFRLIGWKIKVFNKYGIDYITFNE